MIWLLPVLLPAPALGAMGMQRRAAMLPCVHSKLKNSLPVNPAVWLLGFGIPLTVAFGWVLAWLVRLDVWLALFVAAAALAPTDAAPGVSRS